MRGFVFLILALTSAVAAQPALACKFDVENDSNVPIAVYGVLAPNDKWAVWHSDGWDVGAGEKITIDVGPRFEDNWCTSVTLAYDRTDIDRPGWNIDSEITFDQGPGLPRVAKIRGPDFGNRSSHKLPCIDNAWICD